MPGKFTLKKSRGQFTFNLVATNGRNVLTSERYKTKASAMNGIKSVRTNCKKKGNFERRKASSGKPYFVLLAGNGNVIGRSQMYASPSGVSYGIASVKKNAPKAKVEEDI